MRWPSQDVSFIDASLEPIVDGLREDELATFHYPRAPLEGSPTPEMEDSMGLIPEPPHYRWTQWEQMEHSIVYLPSSDSLDTALNYIDREISPTAGPFDAVIGFSEGAMLATRLAMRHPGKYRCLVLFSGFWVQGDADARSHAPSDKSTVLQVPSLHVMGMKDPMGEAGVTLYALFDSEKAQIVQHEQGHVGAQQDRCVKAC